MATFKKIFPSRFNTGVSINSGNSAFSDLTLGAAVTNWNPWYEVPGCFARQAGSGNSSSIRITANNTPTQDHEILAVLPAPLGQNTNSGVMCRSPASWTNLPNGHTRANLAVSGGNSVLSVTRVTTGGGAETVGTINLTSLGRDTQPILCRMKVTGGASATRLRVKAWSFQQDEPGSWNIDSTLFSTYNADGYPVLFRVGTSSDGYLGMAFSVGTDSDDAPNIVGTISGQVRVNGTPQASRTVRAVAREDPGYHWDAVSDGSGNFSMKVINTFTYTIYALDLLAGDFNAVIADKVVPV